MEIRTWIHTSAIMFLAVGKILRYMLKIIRYTIFGIMGIVPITIYIVLAVMGEKGVLIAEVTVFMSSFSSILVLVYYREKRKAEIVPDMRKTVFPHRIPQKIRFQLDYYLDIEENRVTTYKFNPKLETSISVWMYTVMYLATLLTLEYVTITLANSADILTFITLGLAVVVNMAILPAVFLAMKLDKREEQILTSQLAKEDGRIKITIIHGIPIGKPSTIRISVPPSEFQYLEISSISKTLLEQLDKFPRVLRPFLWVVGKSNLFVKSLHLTTERAEILELPEHFKYGLEHIHLFGSNNTKFLEDLIVLLREWAYRPMREIEAV